MITNVDASLKNKVGLYLWSSMCGGFLVVFFGSSDNYWFLAEYSVNVFKILPY